MAAAASAVATCSIVIWHIVVMYPSIVSRLVYLGVVAAQAPTVCLCLGLLRRRLWEHICSRMQWNASPVPFIEQTNTASELVDVADDHQQTINTDVPLVGPTHTQEGEAG